MLSTTKALVFSTDIAAVSLLVFRKRTVQEDPSGTSGGKTEESGLQRRKRLDVVTKQPFQLLQSPVPTLEQLVPVLRKARKSQGTKLQIPPYLRTTTCRGQ